MRFPLPVRPSRNLVDGRPIVVGVELVDGGRGLGRVWSQVLLVNEAFAADYEEHDSGFAILHGSREDGKAAGHLSVHDEALRSARCTIALSGKDAQCVAIDSEGMVWRERREG